MSDAKSILNRLIPLYERKDDKSVFDAYSRIVQALWKRSQIGRDVRTLEHIAEGRQEAGHRLAVALEKLLDWKMRDKIPTVTVRYPPIDGKPDPRRQRALDLSMEQRRERLDKE